MRIAVYTLCRDRAVYTEHCFNRLWDYADYPFDHFVIDNGSTDGTVIWLASNRQRFKSVVLLPENAGISRASNLALDIIGNGYDIIVKMDNDCEIVTPGLFQEMVKVYEFAGRPLLLSPRVEGINRQPKRVYNIHAGHYTIGRTGIVGGLCHWLPAATYQRYRYPETLPKAWGQDDDLCAWCYKQNVEMGYVEALTVNHYETTGGQAERYPDYFERKRMEEQV
jgi:glycosyltransferase involved in cell wall biosynthesis